MRGGRSKSSQREGGCYASFLHKMRTRGGESENFADIINEWPPEGRERNDVHPFRPARIQKEAEGG